MPLHAPARATTTRLPLEDMLERLRISSGALAPVNLSEMRRTCAACDDEHRCRDWLASDEQAEFRAFCPNAAFLDWALLRRPR